MSIKFALHRLLVILREGEDEAGVPRDIPPQHRFHDRMPATQCARAIRGPEMSSMLSLSHFPAITTTEAFGLSNATTHHKRFVRGHGWASSRSEVACRGSLFSLWHRAEVPAKRLAVAIDSVPELLPILAPQAEILFVPKSNIGLSLGQSE